MGYAIIIEDKVFSVNRVDQVTPAKQELRENLTSVAFTYGQFNPTDNSVSLASVTLTPATATQLYTFKQSTINGSVNVDPITGKVNLFSGFTGGNVTIQAVDNSGAVKGHVTISNLPAISDEGGEIVYDNLNINSFSYTVVNSSSTSSSAPTKSYSYIQGGATKTSGASLVYSKKSGYSAATVDPKTGVVTFGSKNTTLSDRAVTVTLTVTLPNGIDDTIDATVTQTKNTVTGITASYIGDTTKGHTVVLTDFNYTLTWSAGSAPSNPSSPTLSPTNTKLVVGDNNFTLTCGGKSTTVTVTVVEVVSTTIDVESSNTNGYYFKGQTLTKADFVVTNQDGDIIDDYTFTPTSFSSTGAQVITFTKGSATKQFNVNILNPIVSTQSVKKKGPSNSNAANCESKANVTHFSYNIDLPSGGGTYLIGIDKGWYGVVVESSDNDTATLYSKGDSAATNSAFKSSLSFHQDRGLKCVFTATGSGSLGVFAKVTDNQSGNPVLQTSCTFSYAKI